MGEIEVFKLEKSRQIAMFEGEKDEAKITIKSNLPKGYRVSCRCLLCKRFASHQAYLTNPNGYVLEYYKHSVKRVA